MATEVDNEWANVESSDRDDLCDLLKEVKGRNTEHRAALRIKELEAKLAALDWTPITESNLPNRGDEALMLPTETHGAKVIPVGFDAREGDAPRYIDAGYTHFRPINPPVQP